MHGDRVVARIERVKEGGRVEGRIIRILERSNTWIVGRYDRGEDGMGYVVPFDRRVLMDIFVPPGQEGGASPGEMVLVELTQVADVDARRHRTGRRSAGRHRRAGRRHRDHHPQVRHSRRAFPGGDWRGGEAGGDGHPSGTSAAAPTSAIVLTVTIDGEHARDFDDAITIEKLPNGHFWLGVHIADVSHYVQEGSALDREGYERATSVYFPERAVHMFPAELATGLCSLNPRVDRLVQSCLMEVDRRGDGGPLRVPRRGDQQQRADDLHGGQRHPHRS